MFHKGFCSLFCLVVLFLSSSAFAEEKTLFAIVNNSNQIESLSKRDMAKIFLGKKASYDKGGKVIPIDHHVSSDCRQRFMKDVIHKSEAQYNSYWSRKIFNGKGTPPEVIEEMEDYISYIERNVEAIGYVYGDTKVGNRPVKLIPIIISKGED